MKFKETKRVSKREKERLCGAEIAELGFYMWPGTIGTFSRQIEYPWEPWCVFHKSNA